MVKALREHGGLGLIAAAAVLFVGVVVRQANGEPAGTLATIAAVFGVLGLAAQLKSRYGSSARRND